MGFGLLAGYVFINNLIDDSGINAAKEAESARSRNENDGYEIMNLA